MRDEKEVMCPYCDDTKEVSCDVDDGEGHTMRGVGTEPCVCTLDEEDDYEKEVEE